MAYRFQSSDKTVQKALRRIALDRIDTSLSALAKRELPRAALVHELRKNIKKLRGLIRLVRPVFPEYRDENAAFRDAGRALSTLRDSDVLAATFDKLAQTAELDAALRDRLRGALVSGPAGMPPDPDAALAAHHEALERFRRRARGWKIKEDGFDALEGGLGETWARAHQTMKAASREPTGLALHEWRKRVKDHWYHARLLTPIWPEMMDVHADAAGTLGEALGDARDLALLCEALTPLEDADDVISLARLREDRLLTDARYIARRLLSEHTDSLTDRWRGWWKEWHK
ncbi:CHAD domain-containing protein [Ostreiculturibacter nitratireducens]|uniref:CHAD domain-containing protein n=1 Tax=Ostreiculturibacter nitratireducens TaxID=3075226 RepID=UPI0031B6313D